MSEICDHNAECLFHPDPKRVTTESWQSCSLCARVLGERGFYRKTYSSNPPCPSVGWETSGGIQSSTAALLPAAANEDRVHVSLSKICQNFSANMP